MPRRPDDRIAGRASARLTRAGIVAAAIALADSEGLDGLSMRRLAQRLGVDAMSIYHHLRDKNALLEAMADAVVAEIAVAPAEGTARSGGSDAQPAQTSAQLGEGAAELRESAARLGGSAAEQGESATELGESAWTERLRALVMAARRTMLRHPWAASLLAGRPAPTPASLLHIERALAAMRDGGCSVELSHHALHLLGSRLLGFSQDLFDDSPATRPSPGEAAAQAAAWAQTHPRVAELAIAVTHEGGLGGCDDDAEFAFALDLLLDGLERRRVADDNGPARKTRPMTTHR